MNYVDIVKNFRCACYLTAWELGLKRFETSRWVTLWKTTLIDMLGLKHKFCTIFRLSKHQTLTKHFLIGTWSFLINFESDYDKIRVNSKCRSKGFFLNVLVVKNSIRCLGHLLEVKMITILSIRIGNICWLQCFCGMDGKVKRFLMSKYSVWFSSNMVGDIILIIVDCCSRPLHYK